MNKRAVAYGMLVVAVFVTFVALDHLDLGWSRTLLEVLWLGVAVFAFVMLERVWPIALMTECFGCAKCGYDLRGIESDKCPECGTARRE